MTNPLFLADIDGCLNALAPSDLTAYDTIDADGLPYLRLPKHAGDSFARLSATYTMLWSSLWCEDAPDFFAPAIGFGETWGWIDFDQANVRAGGGLAHLMQAGGYKHAGWVEAVGDTPAVIMDDDFAPENLTWAIERNAAGIPTLMLPCDPAVGMTPDHTQAALDFAGLLRKL